MQKKLLQYSDNDSIYQASKAWNEISLSNCHYSRNIQVVLLNYYLNKPNYKSANYKSVSTDAAKIQKYILYGYKNNFS